MFITYLKLLFVLYINLLSNISFVHFNDIFCILQIAFCNKHVGYQVAVNLLRFYCGKPFKFHFLLQGNSSLIIYRETLHFT